MKINVFSCLLKEAREVAVVALVGGGGSPSVGS